MKHSARAATRQARSRAEHGQPDHGQAGRGRRRLAVQLPYVIVLAGIAAGLAVVRGGGQAVRSGTLVIAGALLAGCLARLVLPQSRAGMLGSRQRLADVAVLGALGIGVLIAALFARVSV